MHIGSRTSNSSLATLKSLFPWQILQTFGWYIFSAWWFSEVYIWSSPADAQLEQVLRGRYVDNGEETSSGANWIKVTRTTIPERETHLHSHLPLAAGMRTGSRPSLQRL